MGLLDYILKRNPTDLLDYVSSYPGRVEEELKRIPRGFLPAAGAATASAITSPFIRDATEQLGGLLAPHVNRNQPPISLLLRGRDDDSPITGEELAPFLALGMGRPNLGRPRWFSPTSRALATAPPKGQPGQYIAHLKRPEQKGGVPGAAKEAGVGGLLGRLEEAKGLLSKEEVVSMWDPIELTETVRGGSGSSTWSAGDWQNAVIEAERNQDWDLAHQLTVDWEASQGQGHGSPKYAHQESLNLPGGSNPKEILVQLPYPRLADFDSYEAYNEAVRAQDQKGGLYEGGHWSEPNVLAHIRTNERDVGGKKALHIEEIQSDWHQQGQKKGYATGTEFGIFFKRSPEFGQSPVSDNLWAGGYSTMEDAEASLHNFQDSGTDNLDIREMPSTEGVPDAPFKKNWHELAFKRALTEAVNDPSIERLTWTTGDVQADRYNLAKYINSIEAQAVGDNFNLAVIHKDGHAQNLQNITPDKLSDYVGKEMAEKIVREKGGMYSGLALEVGGEYHKQLYDGKIPRFAKKFLKKYGVEPQRFKPGGWEVFDPKTGKATNYFSTEAEAERFVDDWNGRPGDLGFKRLPGSIRDYEEAKGNYWYIDITPEMRQDLWEMPLAMNNRKPFLAYA